MILYYIISMISSKYITIRPDNVSSDATISFKAGFPILKFTIQSQAGLLDPRTIRINGDLKVFKNGARAAESFSDGPVTIP